MRVYDVGGYGRSATVLVADDNEVAQRLCRRVLEKAGHKVLTASDGLEAVSLALANLPDLVFMDIAMPRMDGLEAMRRIKEQRPGMVIVVWGAHLLPSDRERFLAAGAVEMMIPPFKLSDLVAVAARLTANPRPQVKDVPGARLPEWPQPGQLSADRRYYWDGERWVPEALMAEEGFVTRDRVSNPRKAPVIAARDLDPLAADLEAVWNQVELGQLALGEPDEDLYSLFETVIAGLRAPRAGNGSGPSPRMRALRQAKHRPMIQTFLSRKYEDDEGLAVAAWDGKVRLGCRCGWRDPRVEPASTDSLADAWREHVLSDMAGTENPSDSSPDSGSAQPPA